MNRNFSMRLTCLLVAFVLVAGAWSAAQARIHSLSGNARFQIGDGLPIPIGFTAPPTGRVNVIPGGTIRQHGTHAVTDPAKVVIDPTQLTYDAPDINLPVFNSNPAVFQVKTDLILDWPRSKVSFMGSGRTGAAVVTFCGQPGSATVARAGGNPGCAGGTVGTGLLRYTRTSHQFGGPAQGSVLGTADVALRGNPGSGGAAPCAGPACVAAFFDADPSPTGAVGAPWGFTNMTTPIPVSPGAFEATVGPAGTVLALNVVLGPGLGNAGTSWGGPWTTGMITASAPSAVPPELFTLSGSDARSPGSGTGSLSLVAGGFSQRSISGPNANRGWLNLTIGPVISHIPLMPAYGVAALVGLTALSGTYVLRRRARK